MTTPLGELRGRVPDFILSVGATTGATAATHTLKPVGPGWQLCVVPEVQAKEVAPPSTQFTPTASWMPASTLLLSRGGFCRNVQHQSYLKECENGRPLHSGSKKKEEIALAEGGLCPPQSLHSSPGRPQRKPLTTPCPVLMPTSRADGCPAHCTLPKPHSVRGCHAL